MNKLVMVPTDEDSFLLAGSAAAVERAVTQLRAFSTTVDAATGLTATRAADVAAIGSAVAAVGNMRDGVYYRCTQPELRDVLGRWLKHAKFEPADLSPERLLAVQSAAASLALRAAVQEVQRAIEQVGAKVDEVLALAQAERVGDIVGSNRVLRRLTDALDAGQALADADWDAVAGLGPAAEVTVERIRDHARRVVKGLPIDAPADQRADKLHDATEAGALGESLALLIVAEDNLCRWQRLRLERIRHYEPDFMEQATTTARAILRDYASLDGQLAADLYARLASYAQLRPLEIHRIFSRKRLEADQARLRDSLREFVDAREIQISEWPDVVQPGMEEVRLAIRGRATATVQAARELGTAARNAVGPGRTEVERRAQELREWSANRRRRRQHRDP